MNRQNFINQLTHNEWDLLVIGGGATGLGVALDAVTRGLKVALIEKNDYASGPTSTSTKLIHGGVRYLEKAVKELDYGQYKLVREALNERKFMIQNAPHISNPLPFILPTYSFWQKWYYLIGTKIYDWIAGKDDIPNSRILSKTETLSKFPLLNSQNLNSSVLYYDGQFNDAFFATALMRTALEKGACCINHLELTAQEWNNENKIYKLKVKDLLKNEFWEVKTRLVMNCAGVHSDNIRKMFFHDIEPRLRPSKGIHIVLPREWLPTNHALLIPSTEDGRVIFVIPWYYSVIIGTTDTEVKDPNSNPTVTEDDIDYVLRQVNPYLEKPIQRSNIIGSFAGYRPLVKANKSNTEALIRNHEIESFQEKNFISVLGGKWTTYRQMAEEAVDEAFKVLHLNPIPCKTKNLPLIGASLKKNENVFNLPEKVHQHLHYYGSEYSNLLEYLQKYGSELVVENYPFTVGEMYFLKEKAQIHTVHDALFRGTRLGIMDFQAAEKAKLVLENIFEK